VAVGVGEGCDVALAVGDAPGGRVDVGEGVSSSPHAAINRTRSRITENERRNGRRTAFIGCNIVLLQSFGILFTLTYGLAILIMAGSILT
jgi:hypothetical protein